MHGWHRTAKAQNTEKNRDWQNTGIVQANQ
jgi:hypothetical protein